MAFDLEGAKKAGYSESEIVDYLSKERGFDVSGARKEGYSDADILKHLAPPVTLAQKAGGAVRNLLAGGVRGAGSIGATLLAPLDRAARALGVENDYIGRTDRRAAMDAGLSELGADTDSLAFKTGKLGAEVAGTLGVGGAIANTAVRAGIPAAAPIVQAVRTAGMNAGGMTGAGGLAARSIGGAVTGGAAAGLVNPEDAGAGAMIGGAVPVIAKVAGEAGKAVGRTIRGPQASQTTLDAAKAAQAAGYVIPPTQVKPSLVNRALEGYSGKITTAQNASARNVEVTNALAKAEIGAADLTPAGIAQVRATANQAYDDLAQVGSFQADNAFRTAIQKQSSSTAALKKDFPKLVNSEVEDLVKDLAGKKTFDAQATIEAIKRLRFDGSANRIAQDPGKKALGKAQMGIANELENLVDRNLQKAGNGELLTGYREARATLAKTYDIEKAINPATFNVDANKLAQIQRKSPNRLTGNLKTIADFANTFPKATQAVEKMGSLPQVSPLDFGGFGLASAATGNPLMMAGIAARPAARAAVLSGPVQNRLTQVSHGTSVNPLLLQTAYRAAPVAGPR